MIYTLVTPGASMLTCLMRNLKSTNVKVIYKKKALRYRKNAGDISQNWNRMTSLSHIRGIQSTLPCQHLALELRRRVELEYVSREERTRL